MKAVILAGGKGTRLQPYTTVFPKPLVPVGDVPILEILLRQLKRSGVTDITLAVGHLAELIEAFFGDGSKLGLTIRYIREDKPLGTVGPLAQVPGLDDDFLMMNGDLLTTLPYDELMAHHKAEGAAATIAVHTREVKIDLGVLGLDDASCIQEYIEKPTYYYPISMGAYVFSPRVLPLIKPNEYLDFPTLINMLLKQGEKIYGYQSDHHWLDIGHPEDYHQAIDEFEANRQLYLPE